jgi:hypothetical protein
MNNDQCFTSPPAADDAMHKKHYVQTENSREMRENRDKINPS